MEKLSLLVSCLLILFMTLLLICQKNPWLLLICSM